MVTRFRRWWPAILLGFFLGNLNADTASKKRVLVLCGERLDLPGVQKGEAAIRRTLQSDPGMPVEVFNEYLDLSRFPDRTYGEQLVNYLRERYADRKPDVILVVVTTALDFVLAHRTTLFPDAPVVFVGVEKHALLERSLPPDITGVTMEFDYDRTLQLAMELQPAAQQIVLVTGTAEMDRTWRADALEVIRTRGKGLKLVDFGGKPMSEILELAARLPSDSIVFCAGLLQDGAGNSFSPASTAARLVGVSRAPVYGFTEAPFEAGIVGGAIQGFTGAGEAAANLALQILRTGKIPGIPPTELNPLLVNWKGLQRWKIPERNVPAEAEIRYREPTLWEAHRSAVLLIAAVVLIQSILIAALMTAQHRAKLSEDRLNLAAESAELGLWHWNINSNKIWATDKSRELFGWPAAGEIRYQSFLNSLHPEDRARIETSVQEALELKEEYQAEYRIVLPNGVTRWIFARGRVQLDRNQEIRGMLGVVTDISARKESESARTRQQEELARLSRVAVMGEMTASIAHELNQPLTAIVANADAGQRFINRGKFDPNEFRELLKDIAEDGARAGEVIRGIRALVRKGEPVRKKADLNQIVQDALRLMRGDANVRECSVRTELATGLPFIEVDKVQIEQVLINLLMNALEAMDKIPESGRQLEIRTGLRDADLVSVSVRDFGPGLPMGKQHRIFEQFYSTKREGMGMGLAIARSIIESHGGTLKAGNAEGGGALFTITLPVADRKEGS